MKHLKTIETLTEPAFIITNDIGDGFSDKDCILLSHHWYMGEENETAPKPNMDDGNSIFMHKDEIKRLIAALQEFID